MVSKIWLSFRDWFRFLRRGKPQKIYEKAVALAIRPATGAGVIAIEDGEMLAVRKNDFYMIPGGSLEPGETLEEAARREFEEETGFEVELERYLESVRQEGRGPIALFKGDIVGGEEKGSREGQPEFIELERITQVNWRFNRDMKPVKEIVEREFNS